MVEYDIGAQVKRRVRNLLIEEDGFHSRKILHCGCIVRQIQVVKMPGLSLKQKIVQLFVKDGI